MSLARSTRTKNETTHRDNRRLRSQIHHQRRRKDHRNTLRSNPNPDHWTSQGARSSLSTTTRRRTHSSTPQGKLSSQHLGTEEPRRRTNNRNQRRRRHRHFASTGRDRHTLRSYRFYKIAKRNLLRRRPSNPHRRIPALLPNAKKRDN